MMALVLIFILIISIIKSFSLLVFISILLPGVPLLPGLRCHPGRGQEGLQHLENGVGAVSGGRLLDRRLRVLLLFGLHLIKI